ncbi:phospholipase D-like domain-containing protein [Granulicoccus phenolivorans]|uniref:phospholipase D-like domain-containing protein n=1 Tax=Granulicoccus phenolivorans TaxID=266854 RepID=UPI000688D4D6|nr:phospholipase D-like domain-containing protein [Granulicoccus phenolivorans]
MPWNAKTRDEILRTVGRGALWVAGAQVAVAAGVTAVDRMRVHRQPPSGDFPRLPSYDIAAASGNELTVFTDGDTLYQRMLEDIRAAKHSIWFESFIWKSDQAGEDFKRELTAAAKRGVQVLAIYDKFANLVVPPAFKRFDPDIHVLAFPLLQPGNPLSLRTWARDHRKILVVDEEVGYVGGYNIGQRYADTWRDTHLRVEGPGVWELSNAFTDFWNKHRKRRHPILPDRGAKSWEPRMRAIQNEPDIMLFPVRGTYIDAIERATESIRISQAYFLPDHTVVSALLRAAERGVAVHVLIPEYSNHILADWAARAGIHRLLAGGVRIHLFRHAMIHAKTMTVDGRWSTIGTTNIDRLSLTGNYEVNMELYDEQLAEHMTKVFATDLTNSRELTLEEWETRPWYKRAVETILRPLAPLL